MNVSDPSDREDFSPGYDDDDPYETEDIDEYPEWWRDNIKEFRAFGLRPYRPPRFVDDSIVPEVVDSIEDEEGIKVQICSINPQEADDWEVRVNGETVITIEHWRSDDGYSVYDITADEFRSDIKEKLDSS